MHSRKCDCITCHTALPALLSELFCVFVYILHPAVEAQEVFCTVLYLLQDINIIILTHAPVLSIFPHIRIQSNRFPYIIHSRVRCKSAYPLQIVLKDIYVVDYPILILIILPQLLKVHHRRIKCIPAYISVRLIDDPEDRSPVPAAPCKPYIVKYVLS